VGSAIPEQWLHRPLSKFHSMITSSHLMTPLRPPDLRPSLPAEAGSDEPRSKDLRAWDLTSVARSAFCFFTLVPSRLPVWAGTHNDVPIIEWSCNLSIAQIHTPS
jgi:hypothetical protein